MAEPSKLLAKIVAETYDAMVASGEHINLADVVALVAQDPALEGRSRDFFIAAVDGAVKKIDDRRRQPPEQPSLLGDFDQVLALGEGVRRRRGSCDRDDIAAHMTLVMENASRVAEAASREQKRYALLLPYLNEGLTYEQAAARYEAERA